MFRPFLVFICSLCLMTSVSSVRAGSNAGASVELKWDANTLRSSPSGFPLYLTVYDAPDLRQLAIHLSWTPYEASRDCFRVMPAGRAVACNTFAAPSAGATFADSAYAWTMLFATAPPSPQCLVYWVTGTSCDSTAFPQFAVTDVRALDTSGASDTLTSRGCVILNRSAALSGAELSRATPRGPGGEGAEALPTRLALFASPNPMVGEAVIRFELPGQMTYHLALYDVSGALVLEANPAVRAQRGSFRWDLIRSDGQRARPGVYFARLTTPAGTRVVPVTVLK